MGCLGASVLPQPLRAKRAVRDTQPVTGSHPDLSYLLTAPNTSSSFHRWQCPALQVASHRAFCRALETGHLVPTEGLCSPRTPAPLGAPWRQPKPPPPPPGPAPPCCFCTPTAPAGPMHGGGCSWYFTFCLAGFALLAPVLLTRRLPRTSSPLPSCSKTVRAVRPVRRAAASLKMLLGARGDLLPGAGNFEGACWYLQCL